MCATEMDMHSSRSKCVSVTTLDPSDPSQSALSMDTSMMVAQANGGRIGTLQVFDVPYRDVKIPLACFCDNTTNLYNSPVIIQSNSKTMELTFNVNNLNITEDFADVYFYASYEIITVPECQKRQRLKGPGGHEHAKFAITPKELTCDGHAWYIESQQMYRSLFVMTWGYILPAEPTMDDVIRCNSKNRLLVYSGRPLKIVKIICPTQQATPSTALYVYSEDWINMQPPMK